MGRPFHFFLLPFSFWALVAPVAGQAPIPIPKDQREEFVDTHNEWRARVGVRALRWSGDLARKAESWAATLARQGCRMRHSEDEDIGENIFFASALRSGRRRQVYPVTPSQVVHAWASEARHYSYGRNRCAPGKACGHYTQIVWKATKKVGCGAAVCPDLSQIWVCSYEPGGNVQGTRPY